MDTQSKQVFISYHTETGTDAVRKICAALEGAGISCWYAPRNVGANYAQSIVEAIRECRVFLLVLNEGSNVSAHVLNEINCAFDRFRAHEDITLLPFRIDQCTLSDDIYYYLGRIHIMDGILPPELLRVQELVDRVSKLLGQEPSRKISMPVSNSSEKMASYRIVGSMVYPDRHFVGREEELKAIHDYLSGGENKLFLVGMGGMGKSEIARMYLKRHCKDYDVVLWLSFEESLRHTFLSDAAVPIQGLSRADFPEDSDEDYWQRKLRILKEIADGRVLLVVDNFDVPDDPDLEAFTSGEYGVIFTTRCHQEAGRLPEVQVRSMTQQYAKAAYLFFGRLRHVFQLSTLSEEEQYLLKNLSLVSLRGISVETLFDWCDGDDFDLIDDLIRRSWVIHDSVTDEVHLHPLVSELMAEELKGDPMCCEKFLNSLVKASEGVYNTTYEYKQWLFDLAASAYARLPENHPLRGLTLLSRGMMLHHMSLYQDAIPFLREAISQIENLNQRLDAYNRIAQCCQLSGDFAGCRDAAMEALPLIGKPVPEELIVWYAMLLFRLDESNRELGDYAVAISYAKQVIEYERFLPDYSQGWPEYHLARALYMSGDLEESEKVLEQAFQAFRRVGGVWAVSLGSDLLGQIKMAQGHLDEALEISLRVWEELLPQLGPEHADMANSLNWRGNIYRAMGDEEKARGCYTQAAEIYRKLNCHALAERILALAEE